MTRRLTRADRERIRAELQETMKQPRGEITFGASAVGFTTKREYPERDERGNPGTDRQDELA